MKENSYFVNKNTPSKISLSYCGGEGGGSRRTLVRSSAMALWCYLSPKTNIDKVRAAPWRRGVSGAALAAAYCCWP